MRRLRIGNPMLSSSEKTFLDADYTSGTSLTVISNLGFADNDFAILGEVGEEKTEAIDVTGTSGNTTLTVSAAYKFSHNKGTVVYRSEWDQIQIDRKLSTDTSFTNLTTINIQWDKLETLYIDTSGSDSYDYRFRFTNSQSGNLAEYSPTVSGAGFSRRQVGAMIQNVRRKIRDLNKQRFTDTEIIEKLQDGQTDIDSHKIELWFLKVDTFEASNGIATVASSGRYALSTYTTLNFVSKIRYKFVNGSNTNIWDLVFRPENEFDKYLYNNSSPQVTDYVDIYKLLPPDSTSSQGYFRVYPIPETANCIFYPTYYKKLTTLSTVSDTTDLPFPEILEDYAAWKLHDIMDNKDEADRFRLLYTGPVDARGPEPITGLSLLRAQNKDANTVTAYGRQLWRFKGQKMRPQPTRDITIRDYIKENFI